ncbi:hypothetical protein [Haloarcula sp. H-GB5]
MDDAATHRRFARAYDSGEVDSGELATALNRYDGLDNGGKDYLSNNKTVISKLRQGRMHRRTPHWASKNSEQSKITLVDSRRVTP